MTDKTVSRRVVEVYSKQDIVNIYSRLGLWAAEELVFGRHLSGRGPLTILDVGCGAGRVAIPLARLGHRVVGLDVTRRMPREARRLSRLYGLELEALTADAQAIPLRSASVDCVVCMHSSFGVFVSLAERLGAVQEAWRVLREGGLFILNVHNILYPGRWGKRWAKWAVILARKLIRGERDWRNRLVDEYGHCLSCHYYTLPELTRLMGARFEVLEVAGCNGFWERNRPIRYLPKWLAEDFIIVGRKPCAQEAASPQGGVTGLPC